MTVEENTYVASLPMLLTELEVVRAERVSPSFVRVELGGAELADFGTPGPVFDQRIKLIFPNAAGELPSFADADESWWTTWMEIPEAERSAALAKARAHWLLALGELEVPCRRPCLLLVGGLPGTGKSTLARGLACSPSRGCRHFGRSARSGGEQTVCPSPNPESGLGRAGAIHLTTSSNCPAPRAGRRTDTHPPVPHSPWD